MYIKRVAEEFLKEWRRKEHKKPLIIRGARQTGKSRLVEQFGRENFEHTVVINFEKEPQFKSLFEKASDIKKLISELELIKNAPIVPGKTLLFIDEIQQCPEAITKLRYFYEDFPELHVMAAGSLLEFVLENGLISFPVGRVEFYYLFPLSFREYLGGCGETKLLEYLASVGPREKIEPLIHQKLRELLKEYMLVGGMPEACVQFLSSRRYKDLEPVWESIIQTYRDDFKKYSKRVNTGNIEFAFTEAPHVVGQEINLTRFGEGTIRPREVKVALGLLERALIVHNVHQIKHSSFPLTPMLGKRSKLVFLDVGLVQYINHISPEIVESKNFSAIYKGGIAEQLVGQELLPLTGSTRHPELFYWHKDRTKGTAEVDYIYPYTDHILPVEVKAGKGGSLASLHQFMFEHKKPLALRVYDGELNYEMIKVSLPQSRHVQYPLLSVPLYMIHRLPELIQGLI